MADDVSKGRQALEDKNLELAKIYFSNAINKKSTSTAEEVGRLYGFRAHANFDLKNFKAAYNDARKATELKADRADLWMLAGEAALEVGDLDSAKEALDLTDSLFKRYMIGGSTTEKCTSLLELCAKRREEKVKEMEDQALEIAERTEHIEEKVEIEEQIEQHGQKAFEVEEREVAFKYWMCKTPVSYNLHSGYTFMLDKERTDISILNVSYKDALYQSTIWKILGGKNALQVYFIDRVSSDTFILIESVKIDLMSWYRKLYEGMSDRDEWWTYIEEPLKNLVSDIFKSLLMLYPSYTHGNWLNGVAVVDGTSKLFNMRHTGVDLSTDLKSLWNILNSIISRVDPNLLHWEVAGAGSQRWYENKNVSEKFTHLMLNLKSTAGKTMDNLFDVPYYWGHKERMKFMERVHDFIWLEGNMRLKYLLDGCFGKVSNWMTLVPAEGTFRRVLEYKLPGAVSTESYATQGDSIRFWGACRHNYNNHSCVIKTVEQIEEELDLTFGICWMVYKACLAFASSHLDSYDTRLQEEFLARLEWRAR